MSAYKTLCADLDSWHATGKQHALAYRKKLHLFSDYSSWAYDAGYADGLREREGIEKRRAASMALDLERRAEGVALKCVLCSRFFRFVDSYLAHSCCQNGRPE